MNVKRKRELITSLTFYPGIAKRHFHPKRVKAHASGVSILTSILMEFQIWRISRNKNQSGRFNVYVCLFLSSAHRHLRF